MSLQKILIIIVFLFLNSSFSNVKSDIDGLSKGDAAPDFTAVDISGRTVTLSKLTQKANVVLLFFRGFWCSGCQKELSHFTEDIAKITAKGGHVIAITPSPDHYPIIPSRNPMRGLSIIIDENQSIMNEYGVITQEASEYIRVETHYGRHDFTLIPATYIINEDQKITYAHFNPKFTINAFVDSTLMHK